jgi:Cu+-exporting ATPase
MAGDDIEGADGSTIDPMCGMTVDPEHAAAHRNFKGSDYWFCGTGCAERFDADPAAATAGAP